MFNDFHESTRNVGMVGILLGLLVLAGFCGLGMAVMSGLKKSGPTIESQLERQAEISTRVTEDLKRQRVRLEEVEGFQAKAGLVEKAKLELAKEQEVVKASAERVVELQDDIEAGQLTFEEYRDQYRTNERENAIGEVVDLSSTKGEGFEKCEIKSISPLHLRISRSAGIMGIPYQELPREIQDRFQFGKEEAAQHQQLVNANNALRNKQIAAWKKKQGALKEEANRKALDKEIAQTEKEIIEQVNLAAKYDASATEWEAKAKALERKALDARRQGRISSNPGHARQARNRSKTYTRQANAARQNEQKLKEHLRELEALKAK